MAISPLGVAVLATASTVTAEIGSMVAMNEHAIGTVTRRHTMVTRNMTTFPPCFPVKQPLDRPAGVGWWWTWFCPPLYLVPDRSSQQSIPAWRESSAAQRPHGSLCDDRRGSGMIQTRAGRSYVNSQDVTVGCYGSPAGRRSALDLDRSGSASARLTKVTGGDSNLDPAVAMSLLCRAEAGEIMRTLDLMAMLAMLSQPDQIGSSVLGLMVWRDIDVTV